jgi:mRNA interferase RelE/StbE
LHAETQSRGVKKFIIKNISASPRLRVNNNLFGSGLSGLGILIAIKEKLLPDPTMGKPLKGSDEELWSFRVGNYRVIYNFNNNDLTVLVIRISHRREVYKNFE